MNEFLQISAGTILAVIVIITLKKQNGDFAAALSILVCGMILSFSMQFFEPIVSFVLELCQKAQIKDELFAILLKNIGIGLVAEIAVLICNDSGNSSLGKALQILSVAVILGLSVPLMRELMMLVENVVGAI